MKLTSIKRLLTEDFPDDNRELIEKLAFVLNPFIEQTVEGINGKNININENLNQQIVDLTVTVDGSGLPVSQTLLRNPLKNRLIGMTVIRALNQTTTTNYPSGAIIVSFTENDQKVVQIKHVTGLQNGEEYDLKMLLFGKQPS